MISNYQSTKQIFLILIQKIQQEIKEIKKIEAKQNLDEKRLPKLRNKELKLINKISVINENPQKYFDPEQKIEALKLDLEKIKIEIQIEEARIKLIKNLDGQQSQLK